MGVLLVVRVRSFGSSNSTLSCKLAVEHKVPCFLGQGVGLIGGLIVYDLSTQLTGTCTYEPKYTWTYVQVYMHVLVYWCACTYVHIPSHKYVHMHTHALISR